jgi:hemolysin type calcium-binding protein
MLRAALCALCALFLSAALFPTGALAASAYVDKTHDDLAYVAANGERNNVSFSVSGRNFTVTDTGAPISAGLGCTSVNANQVTCTDVPGGPINYLGVGAGDMDDNVTITGATPSWVDGGGGNDHLVGGSANDWLWGSTGDDFLEGGLGADLTNGGDGWDVADFSARTGAVTVTLDGTAGDGQAGEHDNVSYTVEEVRGGSGNDSLTGGSAANSLKGNAGNDTLTGGAGDDTIDGGPGQDSLAGGDGNDALRGRDGSADQITCGAGSDSADADPIDTIDADCEVNAAPGAGDGSKGPQSPLALLPGVLRMSKGGTVSVRIYCPSTFGTRCTGTITFVEVRRKLRTVAVSRSSPSKRLGRKKYSVRAGTSKEFEVQISREGRRRVLKKKKVQCKASAVVRGTNGTRTSASKKITVKAPKQKGGKS